MATQAQMALAAAGGTASAVAGGYGISYVVADKEDKKESGQEGRREEDVPNAEPNKETFNPTEVGTDQKYATKLLAAIQDKNISLIVKNVHGNKQWWRWAYKHNFAAKKPQKSLHSIFQQINKDYDETAPTALNKVCEAAYESNSDQILDNTLIANIADFCAVGPVNENRDFSEPKYNVYASGTETFQGYEYGVLSISDNRPRLVQNTPDNELWFKWSYKKLEAAKTQTPDTVGTTFKAVTEGYNTTGSALNLICDASYKKGQYDIEDAADDKLFNNIKDYCSPLNEEITKPTVEQIPNTPGTPQTFDQTSYISGDYNEKVISLMDVENAKKLVKPDIANKKWWSWAFANKYQNKKAGLANGNHHFKGVTKGYAENNQGENANALNQKCDAAYKLIKEHYKFETSDKLIEHIGMFCSKDEYTEDFLKPPVTFYTAGHTSGDEYKFGVLGKSGNETKLVDTTKKENDIWWRYAYHKLYEGKDSGVSSLFKTKTINNGETLKEACAEAYKKDKIDLQGDGSKLKTNIETFCVGSTTKVTLELPNVQEPGKKPEKLSQGTPTANSWGDKNKDVLYKTNDGEDWWKWAYVERFKTFKADSSANTLVAPFTDVSQGWNGGKGLNEACQKAYEYTKGSQSDVENLKKNIKQFCTDNQQGTTINEPEQSPS